MKIYIGKEENPISATEFVDKIFAPNKEGLKKQKEKWVNWVYRDKDDKSITLDNVEHSDSDEPLDLDVKVRPYLVYKNGHTSNIGFRKKSKDVPITDDLTFDIHLINAPYHRAQSLSYPKLLFKRDNEFRYKQLKTSFYEFYVKEQILSGNTFNNVLQGTLRELVQDDFSFKEENLREGYYTLNTKSENYVYIKSIDIIHTSKSYSDVEIKFEEGVDLNKAINSKGNIDKTAFRNKRDVSGNPYHMQIKFYKDFKFDAGKYEFNMDFVRKTTLQKLSEKSKRGKPIVEKEIPITCNKVSPTKIEFVVDMTNPEIGLYRLYNINLRLNDAEFFRVLKFITPEFRIVETGNF